MTLDPGDSWYVRSRGKILGPFAFRQVVILRDQRRLAKFDEVSRGDRRSWVAASSMPELFPDAGSTPDREPEPVAANSAGADYSLEANADPVEEPRWHYMNGQTESSPLSFTELHNLVSTGVVRQDTLVWTAELPNWTPASNVPALGFGRSRPIPRPAPPAAGAGDSTLTSGVGLGGAGFSVASFVLGLINLLAGILTVLSAALTSEASRNREAMGLIFVGLTVAWAVSSLLAVTFGTLGVTRPVHAGSKRPGFGLALAGLILGILGLLSLVVVFFLAGMGLLAGL